MDLEQIRVSIDTDLLMYQDIDDLFEAITRKGDHNIDVLSMPWFDGKYITGDINLDKRHPVIKTTDFADILNQIKLEQLAEGA
jgi:glutamine phosphoribosylpyrophosphate amidotransferase